mgnify:CR=1 FL=1
MQSTDALSIPSQPRVAHRDDARLEPARVHARRPRGSQAGPRASSTWASTSVPRAPPCPPRTACAMTLRRYVGYPKDVVSRKLLKKDVLFGDEAIEKRLSLPISTARSATA